MAGFRGHVTLEKKIASSHMTSYIVSVGSWTEVIKLAFVTRAVALKMQSKPTLQGPKLTFLGRYQLATEMFFSVPR